VPGNLDPGREGVRTCSSGVKVFPGSTDISGSLSDFKKTDRRGRIFPLQAVKLFGSLITVLCDKEAVAMSRFKPVLSLLVLGMFSAPVAADEDIFKIGVDALNKKDYRFAIACFNDVLCHESKDSEAYFYLGLAHHGKGEYANAIKDFSETIRLNSKHAQAYTNRGNAYAALKNYKNAIADHTKAIQLDPKLAQAYTNRGNTYKTMGDKRAIEDFSAAIRLNPKDPSPHVERGSIYLEGDNFDKAIQDFNRALDVDPNISDPVVFISRAKAYHEKSDYVNAIEDYSKAIRLNPRNAMSYLLRCRTNQEMGEWDKASEDCEKGFELRYYPTWGNYDPPDFKRFFK
jgi:tetratricopeptide (TPR) repeat protein